MNVTFPSVVIIQNVGLEIHLNITLELTVNSRPIIQNLLTIPQEYIQFLEIVGQHLEAHIRRDTSGG
jgi:hypothetical protein